MEKQTPPPSSVPAVWQVGDIILDQYEVMGTLGQGGMGTVYKVHHRGWNIDLAVKSPKPAIFARAGGKENFIREAETWVNLGLHPHIVSCYYVRTLGGIPRVFAEYVAGGSLADWIRTRKLYEGGHEKALARMLDIAIQFAWGLHYVHEQGVVHQNVKPSTVMMTPDCIAKLTGFGLAEARAMAGEPDASGGSGKQSIQVSSQGMTPAYCSPEQAAGGALSQKTDIWSWGVSVLEMFVGEVTWMAGIVAREALASHEGQDPAIPLMPAEVVKLLARCFQQRPENRPTTMLEVATELQAIYARLVRYPYPREAPKPAEALADSLNNRALSLFDLGKAEEAKQVWEQALKVDPQHLETTYNRGVVLWRRGELTDDVLVQQLEEVRSAHGDGWLARYLLTLVHAERGDGDTALSLLEEAAQRVPAGTEVQALLEQVRSDTFSSGRCLHTLEEHTGYVNSVSLSADGHLALSGSDDGTVRLWETATGLCLRTLENTRTLEWHTDPVRSVSLSADGRLALSGGHDGTVRLWETATGLCLRTFQGHTSQVHSVSLSSDGHLALSGSLDKTVRLWEAATERCLRTFTDHTSFVDAVSLSADGRLALSGGADQTMRLWEVATGRCLHVFEGHTGGVESVCLSADGHLALSGSEDKTLRLWEVATGHCLRTFQGSTYKVRSVSLSADGRFALSGDGQTMRLWEVATGRCLRTFQEPTYPVRLSADGRIALSGSGHAVRLWEMPHKHFFYPVRLSQVRSLADMVLVETQLAALLQQAEEALGKARFAIALGLISRARSLPGWERSTKSLEGWARLSLYCPKIGLRAAWLTRTFQGHSQAVISMSLSADGYFALSGSWDWTVRLWEVASGRCRLQVLEGLSVHLSADGCFALSGGTDGTMRLWETTTGQCLRSFIGHTSAVTSVCLSADGRWALSGSRDRTVRLWEVASGRCLHIFLGHTGIVWSVYLSADGRWALSGANQIQVWELATGRCLHTFQEQPAHLSADGCWALSPGNDSTLRLWEVATGHCLRTFQGHTDRVSSVSLSADGRWALSGSRDRTVRLWEVATGQCLRTFQGHTEGVSSVSLSADGHWVLSGSEDGTMQLWELDWELEARDPVDWDEGALPYLEIFLSQHTPYAGVLPPDREPSEEEVQQALTRRGKPTWNEEDFKDLIRQLQYAGYGWLRPEGVQRKLEEMTTSWQGPPPMPQDTSVQQPSELTSIGKAWMEEDGTIVLFLRAETDGIVGHAHLDYPPNHPEYAEILDHLGGLTVGESKSVKPWPETL